VKKPVTNADVGKKLRAARDKANLTQPQVGEACGVTAQAVAKYEKGTSGLTVMMLYKLAGAVGVNPKELLP
jgi:transcriptional regulator with XRE-family HTH domain